MKIANINPLLVKQLPSPKGVALALLEACRQEDVTLNEIAKLVQTDPALSGRLVQRANAGNQCTRPITAIADAVSRIGLTTVKQLAMGFSLIDQYQNGPCNGFDYHQFWSHSLLQAIAMQELGKKVQVGALDELFACGLMARIGCLALATIYPDQYAELSLRQSGEISLAQLEQQYLKTDHNEITAAMMTSFGFPGIFIESVYYHETPDESNFSEGSRPYQIVHLINLSKHIADFGITEESLRGQYISELILLGGKLGLDAESFGALIDQIMREWQVWGEMLKIPALHPPLPFHKTLEVSAPRPETAKDASSLRVLLVEDDEVNLILVKELMVNGLGHTVLTANNGHQALAMILEMQPHIVITDWLMPVMNGLELTQSLRATELGRSLYIIMLTSVEDEEEVIKAFDAGVDDYVIKPINIRAFRSRLRAAWHYHQLLESWENDRKQLKRFAAELALTNRKLEYYALTDMLTDLPNRRSGMETLAEAWSIANRSNRFVAAILIDIDYFKVINDTYGHSVGDKVLKEIADLFRKAARKGDTFCRLGGEEFLVICQPGSIDAKSVVTFAERLRILIESHCIAIDQHQLRISVSIGIGVKELDMESEDKLIQAADKALYAAKNAGRNRVFLSFKDRLLAASPTQANHS